jgi:DNA anti-recombination protein RmuC
MRKNAKEIAANEAQDIKKTSESLVTEVRKLEAQLRKREEGFQLSDSALKQMEERFSREIDTLEARVTAIEELLTAVNAQVRDGHVQIQTNAEENLKAQKRVASDIESLASELKEKKVLLAAYEKALWRSNGRQNFWQRIFGRQNSV